LVLVGVEGTLNTESYWKNIFAKYIIIIANKANKI